MLLLILKWLLHPVSTLYVYPCSQSGNRWVFYGRMRCCSLATTTTCRCGHRRMRHPKPQLPMHWHDITVTCAMSPDYGLFSLQSPPMPFGTTMITGPTIQTVLLN